MTTPVCTRIAEGVTAAYVRDLTRRAAPAPEVERRSARAAQPRRARLGATRGGSSGCFGYTGGHGASSRPFARSRS